MRLWIIWRLDAGGDDSGADFLALQTLLQQRCGMALTSDKLYLAAARLGRWRSGQPSQRD